MSEMVFCPVCNHLTRESEIKESKAGMALYLLGIEAARSSAPAAYFVDARDYAGSDRCFHLGGHDSQGLCRDCGAQIEDEVAAEINTAARSDAERDGSGIPVYNWRTDDMRSGVCQQDQHGECRTGYCGCPCHKEQTWVGKNMGTGRWASWDSPTEAETPYDAIRAERERQEELRRSGKFKWTCADPAASPHHKMTVLAEEFGEVANAVLEHDDAQLWDELVQTAAVAVAWLEGLACSVTGTPSTWVNDEAAIDAAAFPGSTLAEIQEAARSCPEHAMKGVGQGFRYLERSPLHSDVGRLRELFTPLANHVWRGVERFTSDTDEHIVATAILREVDNLIYRITAARSSATGEPHVCAATGGECKFFGGEL